MLTFVRNHPRLFAAYIMAGAIGFVLLFAFAVAFFFVVTAKPLTPQRVLEAALTMDQDPRSSRKLLDPPSWTPRAETLRGLTRPEAEQLRAACRTVGDWTYAGDEGLDQYAIADGDKPASIMECRRGDDALIARLWMEPDKVDHIADLALGSEFLACGAGQCPDFAVGDPPLPSSNARPFKVQHR